MPHFSYRGRNAQGVLVEGSVESHSGAAVADYLSNSGVVPIEIVESPPSGANLVQILRDRWDESRVGSLDIMMFCRQLYGLLKAGVPIMRALSSLQESAANPSFKGTLRDLRSSLDSGRELSQALSRHPRLFNGFFVSMVRVGETTGLIEEIFLRLFEHIEFQRFMREQVKTALRYPSFVVVAMAVALVILNIFVIPAFAKVFQSMKAELPLMTKLLLGFSEFMVNWWPVLLVGLVVAVIGARILVGTRQGRYLWDRYKMRLPVAGKIVRKVALARFARSLSLALRSGVPAVQALTLTAQTIENDYIGRCVEDMRMAVERGESILRAATHAGIFTPIVLQMIMVGEESGSLDDMMLEIADLYQRDVEYELKTLSAQIEPILIVMLGALVLVMALGIFLPLWDLGKVMIK